MNRIKIVATSDNKLPAGKDVQVFVTTENGDVLIPDIIKIGIDPIEPEKIIVAHLSVFVGELDLDTMSAIEKIN